MIFIKKNIILIVHEDTILFYSSELFETMSKNAGVFFLCFGRVFALFLTTPLISTRAVPRIAKLALALLVVTMVFPQAVAVNFTGDVFSLEYLLLLLGEVLLGILTGFFVAIIFSIFGTAGQFFSYQMGFSASSVYDALAQVENPLVGQYFNLIAVLIFIQVKGFQKLFLGGILRSFQTVNCFVFLQNQQSVISIFLKFLSLLFYYALLISMPIIGTLFLVNIGMGLFAKAAPQMNLLAEGFPITILLTFFLLYLLLPQLINFFEAILDNAFYLFQDFLTANGQIL